MQGPSVGTVVWLPVPYLSAAEGQSFEEQMPLLRALPRCCSRAAPAQ
ncbi:hypothetical protein [Streptomyces peucetius]|uniref:Uncharacterized protein n=1 Tax=Streptomyces peucetius TaxID=1950 RepID=A0ABY6IGW6_STRPE|nr:hypothetical protein [Streptomyces peucetius]UYQ66141.1 hypothetical protein OGH68_34920 [Streptomyces peucetius]